MKYVSCICICLLFLLPGISQQRLVPATVKSAFLKMYPAIQNEIWDNCCKDYKANFLINGELAQVIFSANGEWKKTTISISPGQLPESVNTAINKSKYKDCKILHVYLASSNEYILLYEIEVESHFKQRIRLQFKANGQMM